MGRITLDLRRDAKGQTLAVFGKGSASFSVPVDGVRADDSRWTGTDSAGDRRDAVVRRTTLRDWCNRAER